MTAAAGGRFCLPQSSPLVGKRAAYFTTSTVSKVATRVLTDFRHGKICKDKRWCLQGHDWSVGIRRGSAACPFTGHGTHVFKAAFFSLSDILTGLSLFDLKRPLPSSLLATLVFTSCTTSSSSKLCDKPHLLVTDCQGAEV